MAGGKQTPRQKLIGLMYLIFLALLALNVSVEVLDSFVLVNDGIEQTNRNFENKVGMVYEDFYTQRALSEEKVQPFFDEAFRIQAAADSLVAFILRKRTEMMAIINNIPFEEAAGMDLMDLKRKDQYSASSRYFLTEGNTDPTRPGGEGSRAWEMKNEIAGFKNLIIEILARHDLDHLVQLGLDVEGPFFGKDRNTPISWQQLMFDRVIPVAVATNLSRLVTDVRNAEFDAINLLYGAITADDFKFDRIEARVVPKSEIVFLNETYEAEVFVAAIDTRQNPEIIVGGRPIPTVDGVGRLRLPASATGQQSYSGVIRVVSPTGYPQEYPFRGTYNVQRPTVTVSADGMNLFFIGIDNPVSISAPGIPSENLRPEISAGARLVRNDQGRYVVRVEPGTRDVTITVNAMVDGQQRNMGSSYFRVGVVPDPVAYISNRREGRISREELLLSRALIPRLENFQFDMNFEIESFTMFTTVAGDVRTYRSSSNQLTAEMVSAIQNAARGQRIQFENIVTKAGADGRVRTLAPLSFTIN